MNRKKKPRQLEAVVISDVHLGTYGSKASQLVSYLKSVAPKKLILNGDIIDVWQFSKSFFPKSHLKVIRQIVKMMERGTHVYYLAGNHDENLRRFIGMSMGNLSIENKLVLEMDGKKTWIFHGDVFDVFMHHSKWLAKLGANGYGILTLVNRMVNGLLSIAGQRKVSLSRDVKRRIKKGKTDITTKFEQVVANLAIKKHYDYVICGHIHWPDHKKLVNQEGQVCYLNSGDWVENMTALEYEDEKWHLVYYDDLFAKQELIEQEDEMVSDDYLLPNDKILFKTMFKDVIKS